ncbi:hypothetical protein CMI37_06305 [Candidatus Pacearchaeota archaeon]|nr:hypothetical protein [Candidatus Pacearchaeota archaeon]
MRWLVLASAQAAAERAAAVDAAAGYPHPATATTRALAAAAVHPDDARGALRVGGSVWSWVARADVEVASLLTGAERDSLRTDQEMSDAGWFPAPTEGPS